MVPASRLRPLLLCLGLSTSILGAGLAFLLLLTVGLPLAAAGAVALAFQAVSVFGLLTKGWPAVHPLKALGPTLIGPLIVGMVAWNTLLCPWPLPYRAAEPLPGIDQWRLPTGSRIAYQHHPPTAGVEPRPWPILFLHGGPGLPELPASPVVDALNGAGFHVYGFHQMGSGLSSRARVPRQEYTIQRQVADLEAIRVELGAERWILVGQSWGGALAAHYAATHPERLHRLVLTSPAPFWLPAVGREAISSLHRLDDGDQRALQSFVRPWIPRLALHRVVETGLPRAADALMRERDYAAFNQGQFAIAKKTLGCDDKAAGGLEFPGQGGLVNRFLFQDMMRIEDPRNRLSRVSAPVLVIRGGCDYVAPEVVDDYVRRFPNAKKVDISGAGHEIQLERPDTYLRLLLRHVSSPHRTET